MQPHLHLLVPEGVWSDGAPKAALRTGFVELLRPTQEELEAVLARMLAQAKQRPRLDWASLHAKTWGVDVWLCPCGGKRKVIAIVTSRRAAEDILRNMGLLPPSPPLASTTSNRPFAPFTHSPPRALSRLP